MRVYVLRNRLFCIRNRHVTIDRQHEIENKIDIRFAFRHAEIVNGELAIYLSCAFLCKRTKFVDEWIVYDERIEMYRYDTAEFFVHIPFQLIHFFVRDIDI